MISMNSERVRKTNLSRRGFVQKLALGAAYLISLPSIARAQAVGFWRESVASGTFQLTQAMLVTLTSAQSAAQVFTTQVMLTTATSAQGGADIWATQVMLTTATSTSNSQVQATQVSLVVAVRT